MLHPRTVSILRELLKADSFVTSEYLAQVLTVTSRTIRSDMKELETYVEEYGASIKSIRGTGYQLEVHDEQAFRHLLMGMVEHEKEKYDEMPTLPEERVHYIIRRLLLTEEYCKLDSIADELFISRSTLQNDLKLVKNILHRYGIRLEKRPNYGLKVIGDEFKLRLCICDQLFKNEMDMAETDLPIHTKEDLTTIRKVIENQINANHINLSDIELNNLIFHIAIASHRIKSGKYVSIYSEDLLELKKEKPHRVALVIVNELEKVLHVRFPEHEVAYITIHLLGTKMITEMNLYDSVKDIQIDSAVRKILRIIDDELHLGIQDDRELFVAICMHLKPALHRFQFGINLPNPLLEDIKSSYPLAFQAAVIAGTVLKQEMQIDLNENEMGYLALHIGVAMENAKGAEKAKRCLIVCASGVGSAKLLASKIRSKFAGKIEIAGTTDYYKLKETSLRDIDFVISTIQISSPLPVPVIHVHTILGGDDIEKIETIFSQPNQQKMPYTREELVFLGQNFETREEVLHFLCEKLQSLKLVDEGFLESVLSREKLSPTSYGNLVAIPHPVTPLSDTTFWAICTLKHAIDWSGKRVQFICLLSVEKNSGNALQTMYDYLVELMDDSGVVQQLIKCKSYKDFEAVFSNKYKK